MCVGIGFVRIVGIQVTLWLLKFFCDVMLRFQYICMYVCKYK